MKHIQYKAGYKYQLHKDFFISTNIRPDVGMSSPTGFLELLANGSLFIKKGYAWDGASGPAVDTKIFMRGSLVHDAIYQLLREGLDQKHRIEADKLMRTICVCDGMSKIRAWWCYTAVRSFAKRSATAGGMRPVMTAP